MKSPTNHLKFVQNTEIYVHSVLQVSLQLDLSINILLIERFTRKITINNKLKSTNGDIVVTMSHS